MAIAKMNKVYLIGHQAEKEKTVDILQQVAMVEINNIQSKEALKEAWADLVESDQEQEALQKYEGRLGEVRFALDFLNRYFPARKGLLDAFGRSKTAFTPSELAENVPVWSSTCKEVYTHLRRAEEKLIALRNEEARLQNLKVQLLPWEKLDAPLEEIRTTETTSMELGTLPVTGLGPIREKLASLTGDSFFLQEITVDRSDAYVFLAYPVEYAGEVQAALKEHNYNRQLFPALTGTAAENLAFIEKELANIDEERQNALANVEKKVEYRDVLNYYHDYLVMERDKKQVVQNFARTADAFVIEGWIRESDLPWLEKKLSSCETVEIIARPPREEEEFPVTLENKRYVSPFEFITTLYGMPHPRGIDPTSAVMPFFIAFFGLCMTDAGYGVILALLAALGLWKMKTGPGLRKLLWILLIGGFSTVFFGLLLGGWFGGLIPLEPLLFDTLADPMRMLTYVLAIGLIQVFVGMGIKFYLNVKRGRILDAVFDQGLWYLFIIGLLLLAAPELSGLGKSMAIAGAVGLILTQGRSQSSIVKKFLSGLLSLYNITGYLSDVLSYSRLLALGLATGVIALAINTMAGLLAGHPIGYAIMVVLLIGGHAFNLIINTLGAYIHSSRLQYIEFYNRFYEGGGRAFRPFQVNTRHMELTPE